MADTYWRQEPDEGTADADITLWSTEQDGQLFVSGPIVGALLIEKSEIGAAIARMVKAADEWVATHRLWVVNDPAYHEMLLRAAAGK